MEYDKSKFTVWTWKHPVMLHSIINPALAFNELVLGQRMPKTMLIEKDFSKTLQERTFIPCPHCGTLHSGLKWSINNNAFKNWFGLYCDHCGKTIPCLTNLTSYLILAITYPFWGWFKKMWLEKWMEKQPERYTNLDMLTPLKALAGLGWIKTGLKWGILMFVFMTILSAIMLDEAITLKSVLYSLVIWTLGGLAFGFTLKIINDRKKINPKPFA